MKIERREMIALGGLAAFAAGFSTTLGRMASNFVGPKEPAHKVHGRSPEPEYLVIRENGDIGTANWPFGDID